MSWIIGLLIPVLVFGQTEELPGVLKDHVRVLASPEFQGRGLGTEGAELARAYISTHFADAGLEPIGEDYFHDFRVRIGLAWVPAINVVGKLPGSNPELKDEVIVVGAHYDHLGYVYRSGDKSIYHGADDNASGVATLIELAAHLSENREKVGRTIVFVAFDAEESGLWGARMFLQDSVVHPERIRGMFSLDMVGMYEANNALDLKGIASFAGGRELAEQLSQKHHIKLGNTSAEIERRTDTWPFGNIGIPAAHAFTHLKSPYHQPEDTYDLLDYEGMASIKGFLADLIVELSQMPEVNPSDAFAARLKKSEEGRVVEIKKPFFSFGLVLHNGSGHHRYRDEFFRAKSVYNFSGGLFAQFNLSPSFTLQPELLFDLNGSKFGDGTFRRTSITAPVNLQYNLFQIESEARFFILGGAYYRYNVGGKVEGNSIDYGNDFEENEWGLSFGLGVEIMRVHLGWTQRIGMSDINQSHSVGTSLRDRNSYFSIGYRF